MSGKFLGYSNGLKDLLEFKREGVIGSRGPGKWAGLFSSGGKKFLDFLELWQVPPKL